MQSISQNRSYRTSDARTDTPGKWYFLKLEPNGLESGVCAQSKVSSEGETEADEARSVLKKLDPQKAKRKLTEEATSSQSVRDSFGSPAFGSWPCGTSEALPFGNSKNVRIWPLVWGKDRLPPRTRAR